jgi:outer membrane lipoprotein-sorting protein
MRPRSRRPRVAAPLAAALILAASGCATVGTAGPGGAGPAEAHRALLGRNAGLQSLRATVEARIAFAGSEVSLPGVLLLNGLSGYRLELLDPLDRPLAIFYADSQGVVQYRPAQQFGASLATLPPGCRGVDPADWVRAVLASSAGPSFGETEQLHSFLGRSLERRRGGEQWQTIRYSVEGGEARPTTVSWFCGDDPVMQLRFRGWRPDPRWRLPARVDLSYPKAGLSVRIDFKEVEANPAPTGQPFFPHVPADTRWAAWNLPQ